MFCHDFIVMNVYVLLWLLRKCFVMISSKLNVYALSKLHRNECKWPKNNVYVRMLDLTPFLTCFLTWRISSYMLCQNFFVYALSKLHRKCFVMISSKLNVYALSKLHRKCFVKHERKCFVMTSSYMFCHDFIVNVLSWLLRICFVKTSSYMFCEEYNNHLNSDGCFLYKIHTGKFLSFGWKNTVKPKVARPQNKHFMSLLRCYEWIQRYLHTSWPRSFCCWIYTKNNV